jgi:rhodanese-related sulfurtransferase
MNTAAKFGLAALGCLSLAGLALWWFADHRRGIAWAVSVVRDRFPDVSHLSPSALDAWLRDAQRTPPQIVDARSEEEFAVSHLASARRIDPESNASAALSTLDPDRPIVIYCSAGYRGATLARRLQDAGRRDVWNLEGGIFAWANAGLPLERAGQNTQRVHPYSRLFTRLLKRQRSDPSPRIEALPTVDKDDPLNST